MAPRMAATVVRSLVLFMFLFTVALFVLYCVVMYILCKHTESHFTKSNSLFVKTYLANKT